MGVDSHATHSTTSQGTSESVSRLSCLFAEGILECSSDEVADSGLDLVDVLLIRRREIVDLSCKKRVVLAECMKHPGTELCIPLTRYEALFSPIVSRAFSSIARFHWGGTPNR
jgi:hypothetical protein